MVTSAEVTAGGTATHAAFLPSVWSDDTLDAIEFQEVMSKLVDVSREAELRMGGRVMYIPHRSNLTTQTKTEGIANTVNYEAITQTNQDITVDTYQYAAFLLNEVVKAQSKYDDRRAMTQKAGYALVRGQEVAIGALFATFSQYVGTLGADIDDSILRRAHQYLADGGFYDNASWIFSPGAQASIFGNDKFTSRDFTSGAPALETAKLPTILGYPAYCSNLLTAPATGQHDNALLHKTAVILTRQIKPTVKAQYHIDYLSDAVVTFQLYSVDEAEQPAETPGSESLGDSGAVWIRAA